MDSALDTLTSRAWVIAIGAGTRVSETRATVYKSSPGLRVQPHQQRGIRGLGTFKSYEGSHEAASQPHQQRVVQLGEFPLDHVDELREN